MAELADAGGLNPPEGNFLRVRFPLRALVRMNVANVVHAVDDGDGFRNKDHCQKR